MPRYRPVSAGSQEPCIIGIAQTASEGFVLAQLRRSELDEVKEALQESVYWPEFCALAKAGKIDDAWLPGALGRCVLMWAKTAGPRSSDSPALDRLPESQESAAPAETDEAQIEWKDYDTGQPLQNPTFSGYEAGHYCTGAPKSGWVLYSRGRGGCWNQRTKVEQPPVEGAKPVWTQRGWQWEAVEPPISRTIGPEN